MRTFQLKNEESNSVSASKNSTTNNPFQLVAEEELPAQTKRNPFQLVAEEELPKQAKANPAQLLTEEDDLTGAK